MQFHNLDVIHSYSNEAVESRDGGRAVKNNFLLIIGRWTFPKSLKTDPLSKHKCDLHDPITNVPFF